jgi:hypothetical protein
MLIATVLFCFEYFHVWLEMSSWIHVHTVQTHGHGKAGNGKSIVEPDAPQAQREA